MGDMEGRKPGPTSILGEWGPGVWREPGCARRSHSPDFPQALRSCDLGSLRAIASPSTPLALAVGLPCAAWPSASGRDRDMGKDSGGVGRGHGGTHRDSRMEVSEMGTGWGWGHQSWRDVSVRAGGMGTQGSWGQGHGEDRNTEGTATVRQMSELDQWRHGDVRVGGWIETWVEGGHGDRDTGVSEVERWGHSGAVW